MSKHTFGSHFMKDSDIKTGSSLIVGLSHQPSPMSPPRMRLDDLYTHRQVLNRQKSDDFLKRHQPKTDSKQF